MTDQRTSVLPSGLTGDLAWYIYPLSDGTLGAVPATVTDEMLEASLRSAFQWRR